MPIKLKIGDKVTIRNDLILGNIYNGVYCALGMYCYFGKSAIITNIIIEQGRTYYYINIDEGYRNWASTMFTNKIIKLKKVIKTYGIVKWIKTYYK